MSYAHISSSSLELLPVLSSAPRAPAALRVKGRAPRSTEALRQVRYPVIELAETAFYLCLAMGFAVAVYGFIGLLHL
jgi:hypothetical protein